MEAKCVQSSTDLIRIRFDNQQSKARAQTAVILTNAVVAAIDDFESDQSFLVGMRPVGEDEILEVQY